MATRFTIASVTKQFTAFAVMLLYDRGLLSPDADANAYLPEDMQIPAGITVHHLLAHISGLYNFYNFEDDFYIGEDRLPYEQERVPPQMDSETADENPGRIIQLQQFELQSAGLDY